MLLALNSVLFLRTDQAVRAILFASATATLLCGFFSKSDLIQRLMRSVLFAQYRITAFAPNI